MKALSRWRTEHVTNLRTPDGSSEALTKALAEIPIRYHVQTVMTDAQEKRLIEALRKVDAHGDVAPAHVQDPMTMVLRQRAIQADLMRWTIAATITC